MAKKNAASATSSDGETPAVTPNQLPLFYANPVMLDTAKHRDRSVAVKNNFYGFAGDVNAVPITLIELPHIMMTYPIVFTSGPLPFPVALLGLRAGQNLFVNDAGQWASNAYIPAYIRRYPFIFADQGNNETFTLCIDDVSDWLLPAHSDTTGERLFADDGAMSTLTQNALEFCKSYHAASTETLRFAQALQDSDILVERNATIQIENQPDFQLSGFRQVDEEKLRALPAETIAQWHQNGWLAMLYAHLLSTQNWQRLFERMKQQDA